MNEIDAVVTGATGLIGRWLVPLLTARGRCVGALVRDAESRADEYRAWVAAHGGDPSLIRFFDCDLGEPQLGLSEADRDALLGAEDFFHLGAAMAFGLDRAQARRVNVEGTRALLDLASRAPRVRRFVHVGGFRLNATAGRHDAASLARLGAYEISKLEADALVQEREREGLPVTRVQPGMIIGDSRTGETTLFWGFSDLVRDLFGGKLPALAGGEGFWMPLVTVDHAAAFIAGIPDLEAAAESEYVLIDDGTPPLVELLERVARHLGVKPVRRAVPKGALAVFLRMGGERLTGVSAEALSFLGTERYDVDATKRAERAMGLDVPDIERATLRSADFLLATAFGRDGARRRAMAAGMRRTGGIPTFVEGDPATCDLLLLPGIPLDASSWDDVARELDQLGPQPARVARADLPGLGRTTGMPSDGGAPSRVWMESLLAGNAARPLIVAHSLGTQYAVEYAAAHPDRVSALVLVSPFFLQAPPPLLLRNALTGAVAMGLMRDRDLVDLVGEEHASAPRAHLERPGARTRVARALAGGHRTRAELAKKLRALDVPVTIVVGARDPLIEEAGNARVVVIDDVGHFPQLDAPRAVAFAVARARAATLQWTLAQSHATARGHASALSPSRAVVPAFSRH